MSPSYGLYALAALALSTGITCQVNYTDAAVAPQPLENYYRYQSLFGNGTRTYTCDPTSGSNIYTLTDLNYNLYPVLPELNLTYLVGRRVYLAKPDYDNGTFAFYTKVGAFTYWVGRAVQDAPDPSSTSAADLPEELELVTERSEPKPGQTDYDLGIATYITRYGAVGGNLPADQKCTPATAKVIVPNTIYYSFWSKLV